MLKLRISLSDFITKVIPIFLLGLNYILYNALGFEQFKDFLRIFSVVLLICGILIRRKWSFSWMEVIFIFMIILEIFINGSSVLNLIVAFVIGLVFRADDFSYTVNRLYRVGLLLLLVMLVALVSGVSSNVSYVSTMGRYRTTLGFENPNVASIFYSSILYLFILSRKKLKIWHLVISLFLTIFVFYFTDSRTSFYSMLIFIVALLLMRTPSIKKKLAWFFIYAIDILFVLNFVSVFFLNRLYRFDALLSYRISSYSNMVNSTGIREFLFGGTTFNVDNFYYMFLFGYGIIAFALFAFLVHVGMKNLFTSGKYYEMAFMFSFFILGLLESSIIRPEILSVVLVWILIFKRYPKADSSKDILVPS